MNVTREITKLTGRELERGTNLDSSWHNDYRDTAWLFIGNLPKRLTEGDVLCVFSQFGEIEDMNLARDAATGKRKGFAFVKYEDWHSTVLTVDNFNGSKLLGQEIRVDHARYDPPKKKKEEEAKLTDEQRDMRSAPGHAYGEAGGVKVMGGLDMNNGYNVAEAAARVRIEGKKAVSDGWAAADPVRNDDGDIEDMNRRKRRRDSKTGGKRSSRHCKIHKHHKEKKNRVGESGSVDAEGNELKEKRKHEEKKGKKERREKKKKKKSHKHNRLENRDNAIGEQKDRSQSAGERGERVGATNVEAALAAVAASRPPFPDYSQGHQKNDRSSGHVKSKKNTAGQAAFTSWRGQFEESK